MTLTEEQRGTVGFDLEKNRAAIDSAINSLLCEGWDNEASTVRRLVAEIERLRAGAIKGNQFVHELMANCNSLRERVWTAGARIEELEAENKRALLELQKSKNRNMCEERVKKDMQQAARIKELEAQLTITNVALETATRKPNVVYITGTGELGPDADAKPQVWQITEERKAALSAMSSLRTDVDCPQCDAWLHFSDIAEHAPVLRAMLTEAA